MSMSIEEQRRRCAELRGWVAVWEEDIRRTVYVLAADALKWPLDEDQELRVYIPVDDYLPDTNVQQAAELKARLVELGISYRIWSPVIATTEKRKERKTYVVVLESPMMERWSAESEVSEEVALCEAVAEMQANGKDKT